MHPLRSFSKLLQFSLLAETISFSLLHLLIPNGGVLFTPHLLHRACQKSLSSPSSPHFPFDSSFILKVSGREGGDVGQYGPGGGQAWGTDDPATAPFLLSAPIRIHLL